MLVKVFVLAILAVANCQDHHQTYSVSTVITHDEPKKVETPYYFQPELPIVPVVSAPAPAAVPTLSQGPPQHAKYNFGDIKNYFIRPQPPPKNPAPVHENVVDVSSPAPLHRPVAQQIPLQSFGPVQQLQHPVQQVQLVQHSIPQIQHSVSQVQHSVPQVQHSFPQIQHSIPQVQHSFSQVQHSTPQVQHSVEVHHSPVVHASVPHIDLQPVHLPILPIEEHQIPIHHEDNQVLHAEESHEQQGESHDEHYEDYYAYPKYSYEYKVDDPHTHDNKYQHETRDGDVVKGVYSLHEPNGSIRTVEYSSDKKTGFNAFVKNTGVTKHVEPHHH